MSSKNADMLLTAIKDRKLMQKKMTAIRLWVVEVSCARSKKEVPKMMQIAAVKQTKKKKKKHDSGVFNEPTRSCCAVRTDGRIPPT